MAEAKDEKTVSVGIDSGNSDVESGVVESTADSGEEPGWSRSLSPRAVIMLSLGGGIGTGLWVGTGTALKDAGPAGTAIAYTLVAFSLYIEFLAIGEMTCYKPVHGGYIRQTAEYIDQAAAFAMGMNYWFSWVMIIPAEAIACISVLKYWEAARGFSTAGYITIFLLLAAIPNFFPVRFYGKVEIFMSIVKVFAITSTMCYMFLMASGAFPSTHGALVFRYWKNPGAFNNGIKGVCKALLQAAFSCTSAGWVAITAGEMKEPRKTVKGAIMPLFWRMFMFFVVNIWLVGMCVPYNNADMNNSSGTLASPFIIAIRDGGSPIFADIMNALVFITVFSCSITSYYVASRAMTHMSDLGIIHSFFGQKDAAGRPWIAMISSGVLGGGLTYLNLNNTASQVYSWFSSLVGVAAFCNWGLIYLSHIRFRQGLKAQGIDYKKLTFYARFGPWPQYLGLLLVFCYLAAQLYFAIFPFSGKPSASNFFSTYITVPLFIIDYFVYKWWFKTKIVAPKDMNFKPAVYFDRLEEEEKEQERLNPTPKGTMLERIWRLRTVLIG
ncbi:amino acid transporter-8 [Coleophoma cylindrospora]|uniref:Amino acid transporter-8 n=1 Tax=Coleophoma cylindrospora TaxID=1849047 RepID=A0A3D8R2D0_9HELO|nr:amino acid transporter-8 [Coleophoma cylindrospora]